MKPRKPKGVRWYLFGERTESKEDRWGKAPPEESPEGTEIDLRPIGLRGNSIEERLREIQILLSQIAKNISFIAIVILVFLIFSILTISNS